MNLAKRRIYFRDWVHKNKDKYYSYMKKYRSVEKNKVKRRARRKVEYEIFMGRIKRKSCKKCGKKAHAHHEDYLKPLEIIWLCPKHHKEVHKLK